MTLFGQAITSVPLKLNLEIWSDRKVFDWVKLLSVCRCQFNCFWKIKSITNRANYKAMSSRGQIYYFRLKFHYPIGMCKGWSKNLDKKDCCVLICFIFPHSLLYLMHFGRLPFRLSSISVVFHFGCLPFWSSSISVLKDFKKSCRSRYPGSCLILVRVVVIVIVT